MKKKLPEMSLEELWELFPIVLEEHRDCWKSWFTEEKEFLEDKLCQIEGVIVSHIGSTAIKGIWAKPIIDILVEAPLQISLEKIQTALENTGYITMSKSENRISLNKGYTEEGFSEKVFHLHLRRTGDNDELYFRDYLLKFPDVAKDYETLKLGLWKKFEYDREGYTRAKTDFIVTYTDIAKGF